MKDSVNKFNSKLDQEQTRALISRLQKRLSEGEIRSEAELKQRLQKELKALTERGKLVIELPVIPGDIISSERLKDFFESVSDDISVLFIESDNIELSVQKTAELIDSQIRKLEYTIGNIKSELSTKRQQIAPGSGWSLIHQNSFEQGYSDILGRAESPYDLFKDVRTGISQESENNPIKNDARVDDISKKLILPELHTELVGFNDIDITVTNNSLYTPQRVDDIDIFNSIDLSNETFSTYFILSDQPLVGDISSSGINAPSVTSKLIAGSPSAGGITASYNEVKRVIKQRYYVHILSSGLDYKCYSDLEQQTELNRCIFDTNNKCQWGYDEFYSLNCTNGNCSRYQTRVLSVSGAATAGYDYTGTLEDGYGNDTGMDLLISGTLYPGQIYQIDFEPGDTAGLIATMELDLAKSMYINWLEFYPVTSNPFTINSIKYSKPGSNTKLPIISKSINVGDDLRIDFPKIEAEKIYVEIQQENYNYINYNLDPAQIIRNNLIKLKNQKDDFSIEEFYDISLSNILIEHFPSGPFNERIGERLSTTQKMEGYLYQFGFFNILCGLSEYADTAISVSTAIRATTPRVFGIEANQQDDQILSSGLLQENNGTLEFSLVKFNYDQNGILINIDDIPMPYISGNLITERLFIDNNNEGYLRFAHSSIDSINVLTLNTELESDEYIATTVNEAIPRTKIKIDRNDVSETSIIIVQYKPRVDINLNRSGTLKLVDNSSKQVAWYNLDYLITASSKSANRSISYCDLYLRMILRRNSPDLYKTPSVEDYRLLISESDPGRFF